MGIAAWRCRSAGPGSLHLAARHGFEAVQIDLGGPVRGLDLKDSGVISAYADARDSTGIDISAIAANVINDIGLPSQEPNDVRAIDRWFDTAVAAAAILGARAIIVPRFGRRRIRDQESFAATTVALRRLVARVAGTALVLASETDLGADHQMQLFDEVESSRLRIIFDTYNPVRAGQDIRR